MIERTHLVFLGDSLTARWPRGLWEQEFGRYGALNLGVGGDRTEWLLWRLQSTQWGTGATALRPRLAVLLIGTNNLFGGGRPESVAAGIQAIINLVQERSPSTHVLLLALWPRIGEAGLQQRLGRLNEMLTNCADPPRVTVLNLGAVLRGADGRPDERLYVDGLHLRADPERI